MEKTQETTLRDRKKLATYLAIQRAALSIVCEQGYEAATAEAIAAKAEVSLRTLFNYFPSKDLAIIGKRTVLIDDQAAQEILEQAGRNLLRGICKVTRACIWDYPSDSALNMERIRLKMTHPALLRASIDQVSQLDSWLVRVLMSHLQKWPEKRRFADGLSSEEEAELLVGALSAGTRLQLRLAGVNGREETLEPEDIEAAVAMLARTGSITS